MPRATSSRTGAAGGGAGPPPGGGGGVPPPAPARRGAPDGEPWKAFSARIAGAVDELIAAGGSWVVVSHGGCVRVVASHLTGANVLHLGSPPNASTTVFELGARARLLVYGSLPDGGLPTGLY